MTRARGCSRILRPSLRRTAGARGRRLVCDRARRAFPEAAARTDRPSVRRVALGRIGPPYAVNKT